MSFEKTFEVHWSDLDAIGHMRNTAYGEYATDARIAFFGEAGFGWRRFEELGLAPVLLREELDYRREAGLGEQVRVTLHAAGLSPDGARWKLRSALTSAGGEEMALVTVLGGFIHLADRRLVVPPPELAAALARIERVADFEELKPLRR